MVDRGCKSGLAPALISNAGATTAGTGRMAPRSPRRSGAGFGHRSRHDRDRLGSLRERERSGVAVRHRYRGQFDRHHAVHRLGASSASVTRATPWTLAGAEARLSRPRAATLGAKDRPMPWQQKAEQDVLEGRDPCTVLPRRAVHRPRAACGPPSRSGPEVGRRPGVANASGEPRSPALLPSFFLANMAESGLPAGPSMALPQSRLPGNSQSRGLFGKNLEGIFFRSIKRLRRKNAKKASRCV